MRCLAPLEWAGVAWIHPGCHRIACMRQRISINGVVLTLMLSFCETGWCSGALFCRFQSQAIGSLSLEGTLERGYKGRGAQKGGEGGGGGHIPQESTHAGRT